MTSQTNHQSELQAKSYYAEIGKTMHFIGSIFTNLDHAAPDMT